MRKKIIAGNWKMNMSHIDGSSLASRILEGIREKELPSEVVVIPPFTTLPAVAEVFAGSKVDTGAQDLWYEDAGAFTGEISGSMISMLGCRYVLVGHSERRHILGEGSEILSPSWRRSRRDCSGRSGVRLHRSGFRGNPVCSEESRTIYKYGAELFRRIS